MAKLSSPTNSSNLQQWLAATICTIPPADNTPPVSRCFSMSTDEPGSGKQPPTSIHTCCCFFSFWAASHRAVISFVIFLKFQMASGEGWSSAAISEADYRMQGMHSSWERTLVVGYMMSLY